MATAGLFLQRCRYQWPRAVIVMATHATLTQHWLETWNCCRSRPLTKIYPHPPPTHPSGTSSGRRRPLRVPLPSSAPERSSCKSNRNDSLGSIAVNISSFDYFSSFFQSFTEHGRQTSTDSPRFEFNQLWHQSKALELLFKKSFGSNSIGIIVGPLNIFEIGQSTKKMASLDLAACRSVSFLQGADM